MYYESKILDERACSCDIYLSGNLYFYRDIGKNCRCMPKRLLPTSLWETTNMIVYRLPKCPNKINVVNSDDLCLKCDVCTNFLGQLIETTPASFFELEGNPMEHEQHHLTETLSNEKVKIKLCATKGNTSLPKYEDEVFLEINSSSDEKVVSSCYHNGSNITLTLEGESIIKALDLTQKFNKIIFDIQVINEILRIKARNITKNKSARK